MALLAASGNAPISYMTAVDGYFHTAYGLKGMLAVDAGSSIAVGTVIAAGISRAQTERIERTGGKRARIGKRRVGLDLVRTRIRAVRSATNVD